MTKKSDNGNSNNEDDDGARKEYPVTFWIFFFNYCYSSSICSDDFLSYIS